MERVDTYNVKQIAEMLNTQPETVRRWIRSGKLYAEKASRKDGHVVTECDLNKFLKSSPKYAGMAGGLVGAAMMMPVAAVPVERRNQSINQKLSTIEQLQREITADQQQISECNFVLGQLANEEEE